MPGKIPISPVMNPLRFIPAPWCFILNVPGCAGIMSTFIRSMLSEAQFLCIHSQAQIPFHSQFFHFIKNLHSFFLVRSDIGLHLHLFKFPGPENKISRSYLVSECFTDLCDTERNLR